MVQKDIMERKLGMASFSYAALGDKKVAACFLVINFSQNCFRCVNSSVTSFFNLSFTAHNKGSNITWE